MLSQVWASQMTSVSDYNGFIVSRFFGAFFGSVAGVLGPRILVDLFFLHQRGISLGFFLGALFTQNNMFIFCSGRAFTVFHWCFDFGTVAGPTLSALIAARTDWTYTYKWTAGLVAASTLLVFFFLQETSWDREEGAVNYPPPANFFAGRIATFFPGNRVSPKTTFAQTVQKNAFNKCVQRLTNPQLKVATTPFIIAASPVTLVLSVYTLVNFGFYVAMNSISPVFLQKPVIAGGYGFNTMQNAECKPASLYMKTS
jgi:hypothetical protein